MIFCLPIFGKQFLETPLFGVLRLMRVTGQEPAVINLT